MLNLKVFTAFLWHSFSQFVDKIFVSNQSNVFNVCRKNLTQIGHKMAKLGEKCFRKFLESIFVSFVIFHLIGGKGAHCLSFHESVAAAYTATHSDQIELKFSIPEGVAIGTLIGVIKSSNSSLVTQPPYLIVPVPGDAPKSNSSTSSAHLANSGVETDLNIDQTTGELRTAVHLDREQRSHYEFIAIPLTGANIKVTIVSV